ncbi:heterokaryon incompatibility protein 6, OR allele [Aspergillus awamori]|uniref:Heterokaryon incompatibility protein 6, OR allele n=1 Tax=Aspergillus awamori TaxID=105351 RepID=A0A401KFB4_ASPAW|nr:heterokaryon incompatibility protein 6, OR allele [Aspergillus awamori]
MDATCRSSPSAHLFLSPQQTDTNMGQNLASTMSQSQELYHKLDPTVKQIRLVTIKPGGWTDDIQCTLRHTSLAKSGPYETLSYVWGDFTNTKDIIVNGMTFNATVNLESALRHLRRDTPRTIWIDAICINQLDLEERASQVGFMRDIYQGSTLTIIWLGDGDERVESLFDLARKFHDESYTGSLAQENVVRLREFIHNEDRSHSLEFLATDILRRPWWTRAWVLQEAVVSAELLVKCGNHEIAWESLWWLTITEYKGTHLRFPVRVSAGELEKLLNIQIMRDATKRGHEISLTQLVAWNRRQQSTDPRDKIFSLLGLVRGFPEYPIYPDYSANNTLLVVCLCLVEQSIRNGSLDVISLSQGSEKPQWPSWVPDWDVYSSERSKTANPLVCLYAGGEQLEARDLSSSFASDYDASRSLSPRFRFHLNPPALSVVGTSVDTIDCLAATYQPEKHEQWASSRCDPWVTLLMSYFEGASHISELSSWRYAAHKFRYSVPMKGFGSNMYTEMKAYVSMAIKVMKKARELRDGCDYVGGGSLADAYFRTLMADTIAIGYRKSDPLEPLYLDELVKGVSASHYKISEEDDTGDVLGEHFLEMYCTYASIFDSTITRATSYRRLMVSSKGYIGLVPPGTQEGDLICVLYGCSVPVILRKQGDNYIFVGESYVHGIMDGEAIEQMNKGLLVEEEFTLV